MATLHPTQHHFDEHTDHSNPVYFPPLYWAILVTLAAIVIVLAAV